MMKDAIADRRRLRWVACALLFGATLLNYLDRQTLSVLAPLIRQDMNLDLEALGLVFAAFLWSYTAGQILAGLIIDRLDVRVAYAAAVTVWSLMGAGAGVASGLASLLVLRALLGFFEGANWPSALRVVSRVFPPRERSLATGLFQSGVSVGALIAPSLLVAVARAYGWRAGFVTIGALGLIWVGLWLRFMRPNALSTEQPGAGAAGAAPPPRSSITTVLRSPSLWGLVVASAFINPCLYFYMNWLPTYFVESGQSFGPKLASLLFLVYLALGVGYSTGGAVASHLGRRMDVGKARRWVITLGAILMTTIVAVAKVNNVYVVTAWICVAALGLGFFTSNYLAFATEVSHDRVSTVSGILGAAGSISGAFFMWLVGVLSERSGSFTWPFVLLGVMPVIAWAGIRLATLPRHRPS